MVNEAVADISQYGDFEWFVSDSPYLGPPFDDGKPVYIAMPHWKKHEELSIQERIDFLQRFIIVHSYIYYELNNNVISDMEYDKASKELTSLKECFPEEWKNSQYYKQFGDEYNGSTGFTLYHDLDEKQKKIIKSIAHIL